MPVSLVESQALDQISGLLYDFLPGKPHPFADQRISFQGIAHELRLAKYWTGGSKRPSIHALLAGTLEGRRDQFCRLILAVVRKGMTYRANKRRPITRKEIDCLNDLITKVGFKIPELWDQRFLGGLPTDRVEPDHAPSQDLQNELDDLKTRLVALSESEPRRRGFEFETFLNSLFAAFALSPRTPFRLVGEQIDGSLQFEGETYLIEARWQNVPTGNRELLAFQGQVEGKAVWTRGIFISYSGFTEEGQLAFTRGRPTSIIGISGQDLFLILEGHMSLKVAIGLKARRAAETGNFLVTVHELEFESRP